MDFDINSAYQNYIASQASAAKAPNVSKDYSKATDIELMDACKQFEAYFLEQCFKEMMKTVGKEEFTSSSTSTLVDYYKDEMIKQVASDSTETNSLGLAQMLYEQMKRNYDL